MNETINFGSTRLRAARRFVKKHAVFLAFLLVAVAGIYTVHVSARSASHELWESQLAGCERTNRLRAESNSRLKAHVIDRDVLEEFLSSAEKARRAAGTPNDVAAANSYDQLRRELERRVSFSAMPLVDCAKAYPEP